VKKQLLAVGVARRAFLIYQQQKTVTITVYPQLEPVFGCCPELSPLVQNVALDRDQ
jgi:hypothetical protein